MTEVHKAEPVEVKKVKKPGSPDLEIRRSRAREVPRPFLKYAGGKGRLLGELRARLPEKFGRYHEPFIGGGALFFELHREGLLQRGAVLCDKNERLIRAYRAVRDEPHAVLRLLAEHEQNHKRDARHHFEVVRSQDPDESTDVFCAAWLIYLNKTAYNGLYRVNRKGEFNATFGKYEEPKILDEENLRSVSRALQDVEIRCGDFLVDSFWKPGDLIYFDSPYVPVSKTARFTGYTRDGFTEADQRRLALHARSLKERGAHVLLTNSDHPLVRELYPEPFWRVERVEVRGDALNTDGAKRGKVGELVIS